MDPTPLEPSSLVESGLGPSRGDRARPEIEHCALWRRAAGRELVPDLAERLPEPTNGGRTYTFTLKRGVRFGPPVNREITSRDIRYAIERHARPGTLQFRFYFEVIEGFDELRRRRARAISGIANSVVM